MKYIKGEFKVFQPCMQVSDPKHPGTPVEVIPAPIKSLPTLAVCSCGKVVKYKNGRMSVHGWWQ